jgi:hypothetical protein
MTRLAATTRDEILARLAPHRAELAPTRVASLIEPVPFNLPTQTSVASQGMLG